MEEVWNDINLSSSSSSNPNPSSNHRSSCHNMIFQDFFTPPSTPKRPKPKFLASPPLPPPPPQPPPTALRLSTNTSTAGADYPLNPHHGNSHNFQDEIFMSSGQTVPQLLGGGSSGGGGGGSYNFMNTSPFDQGLGSSSASLISSFCLKKGSEKNDDQSCSDPRYKRMMKNRESAARSRARRQAYTLELERERDNLLEENETLKKKLREQKLRVAAAAATEIPKKPNHNRSLTAPF